MQNTSCGNKCAYVKGGFCKEERDCPNYSESFWLEGQTGQQRLIADCIPKRLMIQLASLQARFEGVQASQEQNRNELILLKAKFEALLDCSKKIVDHETEKHYQKITLENPSKIEFNP